MRPTPGILYAAPLPGAALQGVSCPDDADCWSVGTAGAGSSSTAVIDQYNRAGWHSSGNPAAGTGTALMGVTCIDHQHCWAVGHRRSGGTLQPLIERYAGSSWLLADPPAGRLANIALNGVTCVDAADCWAVGSSGNSPRAEVVRFDGSAWSAGSAGGAEDVSGTLNGIACTAADDCWAVGQSAGRQALIVHYDGRSWSTVRSSLSGTSALAAVTCSRVGDCWAVGWHDTPAGRATLVMQHTAAGWAMTPSPTSLFSAASWLNDVTCITAANCWAVGSSRSSAGSDHPLVEQYDGADWNVIVGPALGADASATLFAVTCPSDDDCWATGRCAARSVAMCGGSTSLIELYDTQLPDGH